MKLKLIEKRPEMADVVTYIFEPEAALTWQAGQYLHYTIPAGAGTDGRGVERWFTIAAAPHEGHVQITTRISATRSTFKEYLDSLRLGDTIEADGPEGDFTVTDPSREMVFIAGGIGITPLRAILLDMDHKKQDFNVTLMYANRDENVVFKDELEALTKTHPHFRIKYYTGEHRIDEAAIREAVPSLMEPLYYVSGPEPMVKSMADTLKEMGVPESNIKLDDFPGYTWP